MFLKFQYVQFNLQIWNPGNIGIQHNSEQWPYDVLFLKEFRNNPTPNNYKNLQDTIKERRSLSNEAKLQNLEQFLCNHKQKTAAS